MPAFRAVVIGYGNELRGDDALGPQVAEAVGKWGLPGVRVLLEHQLTPELSDDVASAEIAIFVDARVGAEGEGAHVQALRPAPDSDVWYHAPTPEAILALARKVFGNCPPAWLVTIPGIRFGLGDVPSPTALRAVPEALEHIRGILQGDQAPSTES